MIPGIVACQATGAGAVIPEGALVHLDFINGVYFDGAVVTAADVVDHPEWITANGLELSYDNETTDGAGIGHLIGNVLTQLITLNWTVVIEYQELYSSGTTNILTMANGTVATEDEALQIYRGNSGDGLQCFILDRDDGFNVRSRGDGASHGAGIHRIAVTRTDSRLAISVDGGAVATEETDLATVEVINATIGGTDGDFLANDFNFRQLTVYAPRDDADLPSLSA
jgi:hypothetical protein